MSDLFPETVVPLEKEWLPAYYMDESIPDLFTDPSGWVIAVDGNYYLRSMEDTETPDLGRLLSEGEIVEFVWTATIAEGTVKLVPGEHNQHKAELSINIPTPPEGTNMFLWDGHDGDTQSDDLDSFASLLEPGEESDVVFYVWSHDVPFIFQGGTFVPAAASEPKAT